MPSENVVVEDSKGCRCVLDGLEGCGWGISVSGDEGETI